ncbi:WD40 repeat domain-containing protein [Streptomyces gelaticus]
MATAVVDGRAIAVMSGVRNNRSITLVWDLATGRQVGQLRCRMCLAVATTVVGSRTVAVIGEDMGRVSVWDLSTFQEMDYPLLGHPDMFVDAVCAMSLQGLPVAVTRSAGGWGARELRAWDLEHGQLLGVPFEPPDDSYVRGMSPFMVDGSLFLATVCEDDGGKQTIRTWEPATWQEADVCPTGRPVQSRRLTGTISTMSVNDWPVAIAPDGGGSVRTFFLFGGYEAAELPDPVFPGPVQFLVPAPDGDLLAGFGQGLALLRRC